MSYEEPGPQINVSKIPGGGGVAGALFAVISTTIFLIGIPMLRWFLPLAVGVGGAVAAGIAVAHRRPVRIQSLK